VRQARRLARNPDGFRANGGRVAGVGLRPNTAMRNSVCQRLFSLIYPQLRKAARRCTQFDEIFD